MRLNSASLALLAFVLPALCVPTGLIPVQSANGQTSGKYIVTLKNGVNKADLFSQAKTFNVTHEWDIINGFAGHCDDPTLDYLRAHSDVESIAEDGIMTINSLATQRNAPWGLERISQPNPVHATGDPNSLTFSYTYDSSAGKGVDIYVLDSGIYTGHSSFKGRATWGATFGSYKDADGNGHGTHCAGIAASNDYGVAKAANLIAVKVLGDNGQGSSSDSISGMNWVKSQAASSRRPSVVLIALSTPASTAVDNAVASLTSAGVHAVVCAGNHGIDASNVSPARAASALTVGASDIGDTFAWFSNFGPAVKIIAPGVDVVSAWIGSPTATKSAPGTSQAAAYVTGLVAYLLGLYGAVTPANIIGRLQALGVRNALHGIPTVTTVNILAQNDY
ncbi:serine protease [Amanita muscaria]